MRLVCSVIFNICVFPSLKWLRGSDLDRRSSGYGPDEMAWLLHPAKFNILYLYDAKNSFLYYDTMVLFLTYWASFHWGSFIVFHYAPSIGFIPYVLQFTHLPYNLDGRAKRFLFLPRKIF
jgi:hypothetical protein